MDSAGVNITIFAAVFKMNIYCLFVWNSERERVSIHWFTLEMAAVQRWARPNPWSKNFIHSPVWVLGAQTLGPLALNFPRPLIESWIRCAAYRKKKNWYLCRMLVWHRVALSAAQQCWPQDSLFLQLFSWFSTIY